jgi:predicted ester cyclase
MVSTDISFDVLPYEQKLVAGFNSGDVSVADEVFQSNAIIHINGAARRDISLNDFKQLVQGVLTAFPDLQFIIEDQFACGNKVGTRWTATGTHSGPLGDIPATGKQIHIDGLIIDYLEEDKVLERWEQWDQMAMLQQIGIM